MVIRRLDGVFLHEWNQSAHLSLSLVLADAPMCYKTDTVHVNNFSMIARNQTQILAYIHECANFFDTLYN